MLAFFDGLRDVRFVTILFRFLLAFACGAAIGLERSYKNRPAGIRTHILICIGGAVASVTSGKESVSYSVNGNAATAYASAAANPDALTALVRNIAVKYLANVPDANGVNLLYAGV